MARLAGSKNKVESQPVIIGVRVSNERREQFERAAKGDGKSVSEWLRDLGVAAIAPPTSPAPAVNRTGVERRSPASFAASIPGVRVGLSIPVDVGDAPVEDVPTKPWLPELVRLQRLGEADPGEALEEFQSLLRGQTAGLPRGFQNMPLQQRAGWLDEHRPLE